MDDELRDLMLGDEDDASIDLPTGPQAALLEDEDAPEGRARRPRPQISPAAFFVFSMMLFFIVCLLSLVILLVTGRILPA